MKRLEFSSLSAFARACDGLSAATKRERDNKGWTGESWAESIGYASNGGTETHVPAARALIDRIQANLPETVTRRWALEHVGAFPCVPAFLSGEPENMWAPVDTPTDTAPVRIFVSACSSAGVSHDLIAQRGAAIVALTLLVSRSRAVELYTFTASGTPSGDACVIVRLQSHPMMISEVSYALTSAGYARNLSYGYLCEALGLGCVNWADCESRDNHRTGPAARRALHLEPQDVLIGPVHVHDPCVRDPIGFVNRELSNLGLTGE